ncbi:uncharacterized protein PV09_00307 [Verruconis gallopava]|uniref:Heterokaryon incompatibility domain-containing protein n=1 Tax=Verruconis gallopava TaxID=253628 RepID=A0A0D1Z8U3_9PEZI|nr:uncharacterized protein PV09_00307 [Verruconis gallopava]KIW09417.1 hypothetical protein PV09_00307 [Verruconis gallopava]
MSALCEACRVFNISRDRFRSSPFSEKRMHQLGWFFDVEKRTSCPLCSLITQAFREGPVQDKYVFEGSRVQGSWVQISEGRPEAGLEFWSLGKHEDLKVRLSVRLLPETDEEPSIGMGVLIDPNSPHVPIDRIRDWMHRCEHHHPCRSVPLASTRAGRLPLAFTVVDVENMCLVEPESDCRFLALSYVWGTSNRFSSSLPAMRALSNPNSLGAVLGRLAPSIRDAVELTQKLGEKYLWTDALCVSQSGDAGQEMAKDNIDSMDSIYRHAAYVIIAADDDAPDGGIAGVGKLSRKVHQHAAEIMPGVRVLARFSPQTYMSHSRYSTRGWTYQEDQLATRSLIFINNQVYFSCPNYAYSEDIEAERNNTPDFTLVFQQKVNKILYRDANPAAVYFRSAEALSRRDFTFADDYLRGFAGVAAVQSQILASQFIAGLPTCIFDAALLWQPARQLKRRRGFPSWSWAGWHGQIRWLGDTIDGLYQDSPVASLDKLNSWIRSRTFLRWYFLNTRRQVEAVFDARTRRSFGKMFWPSSDEKDPSPAVGYTGDFNESAPFDQDEDEDEQIYLESTGLQLANSKERIIPLLFKTLVVTFRIQASTAYLRYGSIDPVWEPSGRVVFLLLNRNNAVSGYVLLDESWRQHDMSLQEFLILSEANYYCDWARPHENHPYKKSYEFEAWDEYHVMMVTRRTLDVGLLAVERAGVGRLHKEAVKDAHGEQAEASNVILV